MVAQIPPIEKGHHCDDWGVWIVTGGGGGGGGGVPSHDLLVVVVGRRYWCRGKLLTAALLDSHGERRSLLVVGTWRGERTSTARHHHLLRRATYTECEQPSEGGKRGHSAVQATMGDAGGTQHGVPGRARRVVDFGTADRTSGGAEGPLGSH